MRPTNLLPLLFASALFACGGDVDTPSGGADAAPDALADVTVDSTSPDAAPDTAADVAVDSASPDVAPDVTPDVTIPDTGTALTAACSAAGGSICTDFRWNICPKGFEPVSEKEHYACGTSQGWCCRPAPPSSCASSGIGNCLTTCPLDCWQPVSDSTLTCDGARKCCRDVCK